MSVGLGFSLLFIGTISLAFGIYMLNAEENLKDIGIIFIVFASLFLLAAIFVFAIIGNYFLHVRKRRSRR